MFKDKMSAGRSYSPMIEEAWNTSGIRRLKTEGPPDKKWEEPLEAVVYTAGKYLR